MRPDILKELRALAPRLPLTYGEALDLAERQATLLLELTGTSHPAVPERLIAEQPRIEVRRMTPFPTSGASHWYGGKWRIALNAAEPLTRQRFSLAHEYKHVIDHSDGSVLYRELPSRERAMLVERICDHFAGCLLMPRLWIESTYAKGMRHPLDLAQVFGVSPSAISVRLSQLGLTRPTPRCAMGAKPWPGAPPWQPSRRPQHRVLVKD
jgi:predicted transcriptional regulator